MTTTTGRSTSRRDPTASRRQRTSAWSRRRCRRLRENQVLVRNHYLSLDP
jgi:NADPH-dependent curcumin reductase CurA